MNSVNTMPMIFKLTKILILIFIIVYLYYFIQEFLLIY
jgi:hypothetical protein